MGGKTSIYVEKYFRLSPISCAKARLKTVESWVSHGTLCIMKDVGVVYSESLRYYYLCLIKEGLTMLLSGGWGGGGEDAANQEAWLFGVKT